MAHSGRAAWMARDIKRGAKWSQLRLHLMS